VTSIPAAADIEANLREIRRRLDRAARVADRNPAAVQLIAISKTFAADAVRHAYDAGQRAFGENRVQEALQKIAAVQDLAVEWHLVGHLQTNKARKAASAFHWIHSVDRVELLQQIDRAAADQGTRPQLLIQVDLAKEPTKFGAPVHLVRTLFDEAGKCRAAQVVGLMLLPPYADDPEAVRPYFQTLSELRETLGLEGVPSSMLRHLSMGMSHDFEVAVQEGATMIRIGTAIFGSRTP
jgi:pyridoxal phosphate enzyme (YggS family)